MDTDSFILDIETEDYYEDIAPNVNELYDTSGYRDQEKWPFTIGLNKKEIGKFKDEMNGKIIIEFIALRAKTHAFKWLEDEYSHMSEQKKAKGAKKCIIKHNLNFELYKRALFNNETIRCTQYRFKSDHHKISTQRVHKIALNTKDDKRIQSFDGITTYPIGMDKDLILKYEYKPKTYTTLLLKINK